jgi:hypothetical protein
MSPHKPDPSAMRMQAGMSIQSPSLHIISAPERVAKI